MLETRRDLRSRGGTGRSSSLPPQLRRGCAPLDVRAIAQIEISNHWSLSTDRSNLTTKMLKHYIFNITINWETADSFSAQKQ